MLSKWNFKQPKDLNILSVEDGKKIVNELQTQIRANLERMHATESNEEQIKLSDRNYHLVKLKRAVRSQMIEIVTDRRKRK